MSAPNVRQSKHLCLVGPHRKHRIDLAVDRTGGRGIRVDIGIHDCAVLHLQILQRHHVLVDPLQIGRQQLVQPVDDQDTGEPGEDLFLDQSVQVRVVPVGAGLDVRGKPPLDLVEGVALHHPQDIVGDAQRRHEHPMTVQIGRLSEPVGEIDPDGVARTNPQRGTDVLALERVALDLGAGYGERGRLDAELGLQLPVRRLQLDRRLERQPLLSGEGGRHALILGNGVWTRCWAARWRCSGCSTRSRHRAT